MDGTILGQGTFIANSIGLTNPNPGNAEVAQANPALIQIPSGCDWIRVINYTRKSTAGTNVAYFNGVAGAFVGNEFYWQYGMAAGSATLQYYANGTAVVNGDSFFGNDGGFTVYDPSGQSSGALPLLSSPIVTTAITNATRPVVSTANTSGISVGSVVRISTQTGDTQTAAAVTGVDFVVGAVTAGVNFTLLTASNALANLVGIVTGTGHYRVVNYNPLYYPRNRTITNITQATNAQVSTSIPHGLTVGQELRFNIPSVSGMTQLNPNPLNNNFPSYMSANPIILSVIDDYNFTVNINTSSYTAFTFPTNGQQPSSYPQVVPFGEDTATALTSLGNQVPMIAGVPIYNANTGILADSTVNTGFLGMILGAGGVGNISGGDILGPAGAISWSAGNVATGDTMYWVAGKSTYGGQ